MSIPVIILVRPQLVENIGAAMRAMLNCKLTELRIADPRDAWPLASPHKERLEASAAGAAEVLEKTRVYPDVASAVADLNSVYATTARARDMVKEVLNPRAAIAEVKARIGANEKIGLMFGPERTGLSNEDVMFAERLIHIPANPEFSSFNLAQAVLVFAYEWLMANSAAPPSAIPQLKSRPATKEEFGFLFQHLEQQLEEGGFFTSPGMREAMTHNIRNALLRAELTEQEVRTWHGMIAAMTRKPLQR